MLTGQKGGGGDGGVDGRIGAGGGGFCGSGSGGLAGRSRSTRIFSVALFRRSTLALFALAQSFFGFGFDSLNLRHVFDLSHAVQQLLVGERYVELEPVVMPVLLLAAGLGAVQGVGQWRRGDIFLLLLVLGSHGIVFLLLLVGVVLLVLLVPVRVLVLVGRVPRRRPGSLGLVRGVAAGAGLVVFVGLALAGLLGGAGLEVDAPAALALAAAQVLPAGLGLGRVSSASASALGGPSLGSSPRTF